MNIFSCQAGHRIKGEGPEAKTPEPQGQFLNLTDFIALDQLPSLSFFTWEMAVWMSSSKLLSTKRTATVYESCPDTRALGHKSPIFIFIYPWQKLILACFKQYG